MKLFIFLTQLPLLALAIMAVMLALGVYIVRRARQLKIAAPSSWFGIIAAAAALLALVVIMLSPTPSARAQQIGQGNGITTRFGAFTNNQLWGGGTASNILVLTNQQGILLWTNGGAEVGMAKGRGLSGMVTIGTTNAADTNVVTLFFDVSIFGSAAKQGAFSAANLVLGTNCGVFGNYTGTSSNATPGTVAYLFTNAYWSVSFTNIGAVTNTFAFVVPAGISDNFRYIRLTGATNAASAIASSGGTTSGNANNAQIFPVDWSVFP